MHFNRMSKKKKKKKKKASELCDIEVLKVQGMYERQITTSFTWKEKDKIALQMLRIVVTIKSY